MSELIEMWPLALALIGVGVLSGLSAGLLGIGGGAVMVPALYFAFERLGVPQSVIMHCAVATSACVIIVNALRSARAHYAQGAVDMSLIWPQDGHPILGSYAVWISVGSLVGALILAPHISGRALTVLFAVMACIVALQFIFGRPETQLRASVPRGGAPVVVGSTVGALSSLMGIGGGSISVPLLSLCGVPIHRAIGTSAAFGLFIAVPATVGFILSGWGVPDRPFGSLGYVNILGFGLIVITAWPCVPLGAKLAHRLDAARLRRIFGICLLLVAFNMIRKAF